MKTPEERFGKYVNKTEECWLWTGYLSKSGYGQINIERNKVRAHRLSLEWSLGRPIGAGLVARHKCRNRHCVNPEHLEEGTASENNRDMIRDGTILRGQKNHKCKLTEEQARAIRIDPRSRNEIAKEYGISSANVCNIKSGRLWGWLA